MVVGYNRRLKQHLQRSMDRTAYYSRRSNPHIKRETARRYGLSLPEFRRCIELDISPRVAASVIRHKAGERDV